MKTLTRKQLIELNPCDMDERLEMFGEHESMNIKQAFDAGFSINDILWICGELDLKTAMVEFANGCGDAAARAAAAGAGYAAAAAGAGYAAAGAGYAAAAAAGAGYAAARSAAADAAAAEQDRQRKHLIELLTDSE